MLERRERLDSSRRDRLGASWLESKVFAWSDDPTPKRYAIDLACIFLFLVTATLVGFAFFAFDMEACIVVTYVLAVLCISLLTVKRAYCLVASALSALLYNYFFTTPRFSLTAWGRAYPATFAVMFAVALIASTVAMTLRRELHASHTAYRRTKIMLEADEAFRRCETRREIVSAAGAQLSRLLDATVVWYCDEGEGFLEQRSFSSAGASPTPPVIELSMARRALEDGESVGVGTKLFPSASGLYLPLRSGTDVVGVMGICLMGAAPLPAERNEAEAVAGEASLALARARALEEREKAAVLAKNEQLRANLLRSISHDLRTPLTAISGNADVLLSDGEDLSAKKREGLLRDIRSDAMWLNATVENLLAITRLENGEVRLSTTTELLDDIVEEALRHVSPDSEFHDIEVESSRDLLLVDVDARLMVQVVVNLLNNAVAYTQMGSRIRIMSHADANMAVVRVEDNGPGIAEGDRSRVFESFYTASHALADSKRSVGLGLALCKSIVEAHGGSIGVDAVEPHGCAFWFTLPLHRMENGDIDHAD